MLRSVFNVYEVYDRMIDREAGEKKKRKKNGIFISD